MPRSIAFAFVLLAACATPCPTPLPLAAGPDAAETNQAFSAALARRYPEAEKLSTLKRELSVLGFVCQDVPPVEARGDYLLAACVHTVRHDACTDEWRVELRHAGGKSARASGAFRRTCAPG